MVAASVMIVQAAWAGTGGVPGDNTCVPAQLIVKFSEGTLPDRAFLREYDLKSSKKIIRERKVTNKATKKMKARGVYRLHLVELSDASTLTRVMERLNRDSRVEYAEPNFYLYASETQVPPDDPYFEQLWGLHNTGQEANGSTGTEDADIDAPEAWEITTGSAGVVVAVIDTGVDYNHPDLENNIWINPGEINGEAGVDDDGNGYVDDLRGWDFVKNDNAPVANDGSGHGTHVAGTIAAEANNATGVVGVSWSTKIMAIRFLNAYGTGDTANAILAMEYANANGADVINNSWGGGAYSQALKDVIDSSPAFVVCAAGNSGTDTDITPHYPSSYDSANIISVAATDNHDNLASFSNYGQTSVNVAAPGTDIFSCTPGRQTVWSDNFDDGNMDGWRRGGTKKNRDYWDVTDLESFSEFYSLTESPSGDYINRFKIWAIAPSVDLSQNHNAKLEFKIKGISEFLYDKLEVETSWDGEVWVGPRLIKVAGVGYFYGIYGAIPDWSQAMVDMGPYDGHNTAYFRFRFVSDWSGTFDGWYIDDVAITAGSSTYDGTEYQYLSGTSMAAPHVSGIAALIKAQNMEWSPLQVKEAIENNVDEIGVPVATGGRVNAFKALSGAQ